MKQQSQCSSLLIGGFILVALATSAEAQVGPDLSSPDACFTSFVTAFEKGDSASLRIACQGDRAKKEWIVALSAQWRALHQLEAALTSRFGQDWKQADAGQTIAAKIQEVADEELRSDLIAARRTTLPEGGLMLVVNEGDLDELQPRIVPADGRWKLDLDSLSNYFGAGDAPVLRSVASAASGLAQKIEAGGFPTLDNAADAIVDKITEARDVGPVTQPTTRAARNVDAAAGRRP